MKQLVPLFFMSHPNHDYFSQFFELLKMLIYRVKEMGDFCEELLNLEIH